MAIGALTEVETDDPMLARLQALEQLSQKGKGKGSPRGAPFRLPSGIMGGGKVGGAGGGKGGQGTSTSIACWRCGKTGHRRSECPTFTEHLRGLGKGRGATPRLNDFGAENPDGSMGITQEEDDNAAEG